jgi:hypothetical protein
MVAPAVVEELSYLLHFMALPELEPQGRAITVARPTSQTEAAGAAEQVQSVAQTTAAQELLHQSPDRQ